MQSVAGARALLREERRLSPQAPPLEGERMRLFESVVDFLRSVAAGRPLVLFLDDIVRHHRRYPLEQVAIQRYTDSTGGRLWTPTASSARILHV